MKADNRNVITDYLYLGISKVSLSNDICHLVYNDGERALFFKRVIQVNLNVMQVKYKQLCKCPKIKQRYLNQFEAWPTASLPQLFKIEFLAFPLAQPVPNAVPHQTFGTHLGRF